MKKRLIALTLALSLMLSLGGMAAYAKSLEVSDNGIQLSEDAAFSLRGAQASSDVKAFLARFGIAVKDNTLIEYRPPVSRTAVNAAENAFAEEEESGPMMIVTTINGPEVQQNYLIGVGETSANTSPVGVSEAMLFDWPKEIILNLVASFSLFKVGTSLCTKPERLYMQYYKNQTCTVQRIEAWFETGGAELEYPSGKEESSDSYSIDLNQPSPTEASVYSIFKPIASNRCMRINEMQLGYYATVNGTIYTDYDMINYIQIARELGVID